MRKVKRPDTKCRILLLLLFFFKRARGTQTCCHGNNVGTEQEAQSPRCFVPNLHVHVHLRVNSSLLRWRLPLQRGIGLVSLQSHGLTHQRQQIHQTSISAPLLLTTGLFLGHHLQIRRYHLLSEYFQNLKTCE